MTTGVYQVTCISTGKRYIGSSCDIERRWGEHRNELNRKKHYNPYLQNAWNKYGEKTFQFEILEECESGQEKIREQYYLDSLQPEFNIHLDARGISKGHEFSDETKAKISVAKKGIPLTDEHRAKLSAAFKGENNPMYGKSPSEETKDKIAAAAKGRGHTAETCAKIAAANKGEKHSMYGKHHTEESKEKISKIHKGNQYCKGRKHSDETKTKMSVARKEYWVKQQQQEETVAK